MLELTAPTSTDVEGQHPRQTHRLAPLAVAALMVPVGVGGPFTVPPLTSLLLDAVPAPRAGTASGVLNTARLVGGSMGVAASGAVIAHMADLSAGFLGGLRVSLVALAVLVGRAQPPAPGRKGRHLMTPTPGHGASARPRPPARPVLLRRRSVLRGSLLGGTLAIAATQAACSTGSSDSRAGLGTPTATSSTDLSANSDPSETSAGTTTLGSPKVLLVYFSRAGENYYFGDRIDLEVGNTEVLARTISKQLRAAGVEHDVHRIEAAHPYPEDYDETVARNLLEQDAGSRPGIANPLDSIDDYDVILIGSPIWNVRPPMIMHTFAEAHDFTGKTVHPFTTHAMSGLGTAERHYTTACAGATIGDGLAVQGEQVRKDGPPGVADWLTSIGLA